MVLELLGSREEDQLYDRGCKKGDPTRRTRFSFNLQLLRRAGNVQYTYGACLITCFCVVLST